MNDFWTANAIAQIAAALVLIAAFLGYIAWKLSENKKPFSRSAKR